MDLRLDCRHFRGEKPCAPARTSPRECGACGDYAPMGRRILIIKLDALGDVARTTCLLPGLAQAYVPMHVTWLTAPEAADLLRGHPIVDVVLPYETASLERLRVERFDLLLSLDKTARACAVAEQVQATEKRGFGLSPTGTVYPLDRNAEYAFRLGLDDDLKFRRNTRTYQDVIYEVAGLTYRGEDYSLPLGPEERRYAEVFGLRAKVVPAECVVGLNLGGGQAFAHKMWDAARCRKFVRRLLHQMPQARVLLFGGERERGALAAVARGFAPRVVSTGPRNTLRQFQALLGLCDVVVTGDTLGLHLALAEGRRVVALFGPTCAQEIEMYGRGEKLVSPVSCAPCYRPECARAPDCMERISTQAVIEAVSRQVSPAKATP